jgi:hypothetical protein
MSDKCQIIICDVYFHLPYFCAQKEDMKYLITLLLIWCGTLPCLSQTEETVQSDSIKSIELNNITIKGHRQVTRLRHGILTADVKHTELSSAGTGRDVLRHIPYIRYSSDGYQVTDKGAPTIYIDGHLVHDNIEIERLSSRDIEKVEVITNPGAEYDATVKAVVRIYTIHKLDDSMSASIRSNLTQGKKTSFTEQADLGYHKKKLSVQGNLFFYRPKDIDKQDALYSIYTADNLRINSDTKLTQKGCMIGGKAAMNYDFSKQHTAGLSYQVEDTPSFHYDNSSTYSTERNNQFDDETDYTSARRQKGITRLINGFYQGEVNKWKIDFTTDIALIHNNINQYSNEKDATNISSEINSFSKSHNNMYAVKLILARPLWKGLLKIGSDYTFIRRRDRFENPQAVLPNTSNLIHETKIAGFAQWSVKWGEFNATAGLRYERASTNYWESGVLIPEQSKTYNDWLPNISFDLPIGRVQTSLNYTVKKERPSFFLLRSSMNYNNKYIYEGGNPLLQPATNHIVALNISYSWLQFSAGYRYTKDAIVFQGKSYDKNPDIAIFTSDNFSRQQQFSASLYLSPAFGPWKPMIGIEGYKQIFDIQNKGIAKSMNKPYFLFSLNNTYELPGKTILSLDASYQAKGNMGAGYIQESSSIDIGIRKTMLKDKLDINLQFTDIFHTNNSNLTLYGQKLTYSRHRIQDTRALIVTLTYRWHQNKSNYKGKHVSTDDINRLR